ncbi:G1 family glutamic endopeptidase [Bradyrhizobium sp.]|jgi:hypothetical protein|uniref:G1 family glutamic endopeptidase n=1 Tax=Bradyrhizobium sp. TaxID=376 RepID=UPI003C36C46B
MGRPHDRRRQQAVNVHVRRGKVAQGDAVRAAENLNGSSVEWIVEAPDGGEGISSLPKFTPVVFNAPISCGVDGIFGPWTAANTGFLLDIESAPVGGTPLTSSSFVSGSVTIDFMG